MHIVTPYQRISKQPVNIYLISLEELFLRKSKKQNILAQSTLESKKIALATCNTPTRNYLGYLACVLNLALDTLKLQ